MDTNEIILESGIVSNDLQIHYDTWFNYKSDRKNRILYIISIIDGYIHPTWR
jgi:homoserine acetyltransferase